MDVDEFKRLAKKTKAQTLEDRFEQAFELMKPAGVPMPIRQLLPLHPRKFRLDFAWPDIKTGVEIQGGSWGGGRHNRAGGQAQDYEKLNLLTLAGWRILYFNSQMMKDPSECASTVVDLIAKIGEESGLPHKTSG